MFNASRESRRSQARWEYIKAGMVRNRDYGVSFFSRGSLRAATREATMEQGEKEQFEKIQDGLCRRQEQAEQEQRRQPAPPPTPPPGPPPPHF